METRLNSKWDLERQVEPKGRMFSRFDAQTLTCRKHGKHLGSLVLVKLEY